MPATTSNLDELTRAGTLLTNQLDFKSLISIIVEQTLDISRSDIACLYMARDPEDNNSDMQLVYKRGRYDVPSRISATSDLVDFIRESDETVVLTERKKSPFNDILCNDSMQSGIAMPLSTPKMMAGMVILNSTTPQFYNRDKFNFLDSFSKLAGGMLHNSRMFKQLKDYLRQIEELQLYQENIFSSMTNLLVTADREGKIRYFNTAASQRFALSEEHKGRELNIVFKNSMNRKIVNAIDSAVDNPREMPGIEGIFRGDEDEIDFSLNLSPLKGRRGQYQGITLLFTDQSRERELEEKMERIVEERRIIKDMFSRYLSQEIVQRLMEQPDLVKPGGDKKEATILFADIRGYTTFSETKPPEYIIEMLNEYFGEAVEIVVKHKGYIDKFIGDAIMAAWGVPLQTEQQDAISAVTAALEIQQLIASSKRTFFKGDASILKVGIGMHTGPIVAGNLGSSRRMNYTVIGDTVNVAARLEGVARGGEVIITQNTRDYVGDLFSMKKLEPVKVKGKTAPIPIYKVLKRN